MNGIEICYGIACAAFVLLCVLAATGWRGKSLGIRLLAACIAIAVWAAMAALSARAPEQFFVYLYLAELLRNAAMLWVIFGVAATSIPAFIKSGSYLIGVALVVFVIARESMGDTFLVQVEMQTLLARTGLFYSFIGLVSLEQTYRNAHVNSRAALNFFVLGFGSIFAYDLFLYSQVELFHGVRVDAWMVRGLINALAAPMLALAMRRNPDWSLDIFVSRQIVFYTTAFLSVGIYLLFVAIGGFYVKIAGGTWGSIAQIFFFSGALIVLFSIMFSQNVRRRTQVFLAKHFYRNKYDYRLTWLGFVETLSTKNNEAIHATAIRAIAQTMGSPGGFLFTADETGQTFSCVAAWPEQSRAQAVSMTPTADEDLVRLLSQRQWIIDLREYRLTPDVYQNIVLPEWLNAVPNARIVAPVLELDRLSGFVVLQEATPPFELTFEDRDLLKTLGRHVATYLAQHDASGKLAESRQFEAYNRLTAFMMHDLKNSVAQLKLIVVNAARHKSNPQFIDDTIDTIANASDRMTRLIEQLRGDAQQGATRRVDLNELAASAARRCADRAPAPLSNAFHQPVIVRADRERLQAVLEHVIRNAQDATSADGAITVNVDVEGESARIQVVDSGQGMSEQFVRERLFKPFDSTKGSKGMGIGAYQVREYLRSLGGGVEVRSSPGQGTTFCLSLQTLSEG